MIRRMTARTLGLFSLAGLILLSGCSGGGSSDPAPVSTTSAVPPPSTPPAQPPPVAPQPDMLTATNQGLLRGKASGQGQQLIFSHPNLHREQLFISQDLVYYPRYNTPPFTFSADADVWSVRTDGTQDHAVLNSGLDEFVVGAKGPFAMVQVNTYSEVALELIDYVSLRAGQPLARITLPVPFIGFDFMTETHGYFSESLHISSVNLDGSGLLPLVTVPLPTTTDSHSIVSPSVMVGAALLFSEQDRIMGQFTSLHSVPVSGGAVTALDDGHHHHVYAAHVGDRVVSQICQVDPVSFRAGPCDVQSVLADGSGLVVLAAEPANEVVQGVTTDQVIIRRNLAGNDHLIAVPGTGGPERLLMTVTDSEFVDLIVGDLIIVRRPSGTWSLELNGTLTKIGTVAGDSGFIAIGNAVCLNKGTAVWCMPLDGSGQAVKIADTGRVVGVL